MTSKELKEMRERGVRNGDVQSLLDHIDMLTMELYPHGTETDENIVSSAFACADSRCNYLLLMLSKVGLDRMELTIKEARRYLRIAANGDPD